MKKNRKMILALIILASGVSFIFTGTVLASPLTEGEVCSVRAGSFKQPCGVVVIPEQRKVEIHFHVYNASSTNQVCFGVPDVPLQNLCTKTAGRHHLTITNFFPGPAYHLTKLWAPEGGMVKISQINYRIEGGL